MSVDEKTKDKYGVSVGVIKLNGHSHDLAVGEHLAKKVASVGLICLLREGVLRHFQEVLGQNHDLQGEEVYRLRVLA